LLFGSHRVEAGIIYFQNPPPGQEGHYDWKWVPDDRVQHWLDVTRGPHQQSNTLNLQSIGQFDVGGLDYLNITENGAQVMVEDDTVLTLALNFGDPIPNGRWDDLATHAFEGEFGAQSNFAPGIPAYIGVLTGNGNYGWILVVRGDGDLEDQMSLTAIAWAYETIPGKPIYAGQVPAPGALAAFALAAPPSLITRRRRKESTDERTPRRTNGCDTRPHRFGPR
jgi:hypothetical protein